VLPALGSHPIGEITVPALFAVLKRIDDRGLYETRKKTQQLCGKIGRSGEFRLPAWVLVEVVTRLFASIC